ncbi:hypothetical protein L1049_015431 [Liquidambar formosana]|uniref:Pentatricopeptide repeat-containing protein n=1 Tax=Liquidambar formosana TaxID=63359 RepID=A0AAP0RZL3_LIQFO
MLMLVKARRLSRSTWACWPLGHAQHLHLHRLIKGLDAGSKLGDAKKYIIEMMSKGMRPNAGTYTAVFEAFVREHQKDQGKEFLEQMKAKGFIPDEEAARKVLNNKRASEHLDRVLQKPVSPHLVENLLKVAKSVRMQLLPSAAGRGSHDESLTLAAPPTGSDPL